MSSELKEHEIYKQLLALSPGLEERLCTGSDQEIHYVSDMVRVVLFAASGITDDAAPPDYQGSLWCQI